MSRKIKVWDWPVRLCHWSMALALPAMWWTAENGEMGWHMRIGLFLLFVLSFRILWGFWGTRTARFASFVRGPSAIIRYLRGENTGKGIGHNPLGALSVLALLAILLTQVTLGLFAGDPFDGATGPLNEKVGVMTADWMTDWHKTLFDGILVLVGLHLAAIAFYLFVKKDNLVTSMLSGKGEAPSATAVENSDVSYLRLAICVVAAGAFVWWVQEGAPGL